MRYETTATRRPGHPDSTTDRIARGLGVVSIALGLAELAFSRRVSRSLGMRHRRPLVEVFGLREIATGIGLLAARDPAPWVWARVGGDVLDAATLALAADRRNPRRGTAAIALAGVAGIAALDVYTAWTLSRKTTRPERPARSYRDRSGFPKPPSEMRGKAADVRDRAFSRPPPLAPWTSEREQSAASPG